MNRNTNILDSDWQKPERGPEQAQRYGDAEAHVITVLETIPDAFIGLNADWNISYLNSAAERMAGRSRQDLLDRNFWEAFPEAKGTEFEQRCRSAMERENTSECEQVLGAERRNYHVYVCSCEDGISLYFRDTSERQELQRALDESETWRRLIIENIKDFAIFSLDKVGRVVTWNPGAERLLGYSADEMIGQDIALIYAPEDRAQGVPEQERLQAAKEGRAIDERWHLRKDGQRVFFSGAVVPLFDEAGEMRGFTKVARDITDRKRLEDELITARDHLEATVSARTESLRQTIGELEVLSYSLSHDLRAPLRAMRSFSQLLTTKLKGRIQADEMDYLVKIVTGANRLDRLIQDVLAFSRLGRHNGANELQLVPVDLEKLLNEIRQEHPSLNPPQAEIEIQKPLLPVKGHEALLSQCLSNLLINAVKFVTPGKIPKVRLWTEPIGDDQVRVWVEDNGIGIAKENQDRIFGMFQRLHNLQAYEGTGIGLAIVRKAVERMGGQVGVESEPGKGSRFWLQLARGN
jgi:PAS domain S-box-containing protein